MFALACLITASVVAQSPTGESYLQSTISVIQACKADIASMQSSAELGAARLVDGGSLWAAGTPSFVSELSGRAAGIMLIKGLGDNVPQPGDVVLAGLGPGESLQEETNQSGALVIAIGSVESNPSRHEFGNHAEAGSLSPTLANLIPGWMLCGELVAACTRLGKMPVIYETIGLPGGYPRIYQYQAKGVFWHDEHNVEAVAPGVVANRYADALIAILGRVEREQREELNEAATWIHEAKTAGRTAYLYSMGHFLPDEIAASALGPYFTSGVWNSGFVQPDRPSPAYAKGDVAIHIGYQHPPYGLFEGALPMGVRVVYVDILRHRDYSRDLNVIWIDPMWPWSDGVVTLEGYDVPLLPPSGIVNMAIAYELHRVAADG